MKTWLKNQILDLAYGIFFGIAICLIIGAI